jgi:hypothetical protein
MLASTAIGETQELRYIVFIGVLVVPERER